PAPATAPFAIGRAFVGRPAGSLSDWNEAIASLTAPRQAENASPNDRADPRPRFDRVAASAVDFASDPAIAAARHFDRSGKRPRTIGNAAAAANDPDLGEI